MNDHLIFWAGIRKSLLLGLLLLVFSGLSAQQPQQWEFSDDSGNTFILPDTLFLPDGIDATVFQDAQFMEKFVECPLPCNYQLTEIKRQKRNRCYAIRILRAPKTDNVEAHLTETGYIGYDLTVRKTKSGRFEFVDLRYTGMEI